MIDSQFALQSRMMELNCRKLAKTTLLGITEAKIRCWITVIHYEYLQGVLTIRLGRVSVTVSKSGWSSYA
jgi:hypothetical protein